MAIATSSISRLTKRLGQTPCRFQRKQRYGQRQRFRVRKVAVSNAIADRGDSDFSRKLSGRQSAAFGPAADAGSFAPGNSGRFISSVFSRQPPSTLQTTQEY